MIERLQETCFEVSCDKCSCGTFVTAEEFCEVVEDIKDDGWRIRKGSDGWAHYCPSCVESGL